MLSIWFSSLKFKNFSLDNSEFNFVLIRIFLLSLPNVCVKELRIITNFFWPVFYFLIFLFIAFEN